MLLPQQAYLSLVGKQVVGLHVLQKGFGIITTISSKDSPVEETKEWMLHIQGHRPLEKCDLSDFRIKWDLCSKLYTN